MKASEFFEENFTKIDDALQKDLKAIYESFSFCEVLAEYSSELNAIYGQEVKEISDTLLKWRTAKPVDILKDLILFEDTIKLRNETDLSMLPGTLRLMYRACDLKTEMFLVLSFIHDNLMEFYKLYTDSKDERNIFQSIFAQSICASLVNKRLLIFKHDVLEISQKLTDISFDMLMNHVSRVFHLYKDHYSLMRIRKELNNLYDQIEKCRTNGNDFSKIYICGNN